MKRLKQDILEVWRDKRFVILLILVAAGSYGFKLMHPTIGIDDTPFEYYFSEGLIVVVGRWVLFLLNRLLSIGRYAPFLTDFAGVLFLLAAATLWSIIFQRIFGRTIPRWTYLVFACLFLSNPLISEVFTYFLHNGIAIGYTFTALGILAFLEGLDRRGKKKIYPWLTSTACVWVAIGCYESFAVVFLVMAILVLLCRRLCEKKDKPILSILEIGMILVGAILLRSIMTSLLIFLFSLQGLREEAVQRSLTEMFSWITNDEGRANLNMAIKRAFVMYGVFAYHYLPVFLYVLSCAVVFLTGIWNSFREKDAWIFLYTIGAFLASWILVLIEGKVTLYRACQFLPLFCAFGFLLLIWQLKKGILKYRIFAWACILIGAVIIGNQTIDMNRWFYIDYTKYEAAKETMNQIAFKLERDCDISKPLIFIGTYEVPMEIIQDAYVPIGSKTFWRMNRITTKLDEHLLEKFYRRHNIWVAQTPSLSVIQWGMTAFDNNLQLIQFMKMHGHSFVGETSYERIQQTAIDNINMAAWPREGSIREEADCIIINFGN